MYVHDFAHLRLDSIGWPSDGKIEIYKRRLSPNGRCYDSSIFSPRPYRPQCLRRWCHMNCGFSRRMPCMTAGTEDRKQQTTDSSLSMEAQQPGESFLPRSCSRRSYGVSEILLKQMFHRITAKNTRIPTILRCLPGILLGSTRILRQPIDYLYWQYRDWYRVSRRSADGAARQTLPGVSTVHGMAGLDDMCRCIGRGLFRRHYWKFDHDTRCYVRRFVQLGAVSSFVYNVLILTQLDILSSSIRLSAWSTNGGSADVDLLGELCWLLPVRQDWPSRSLMKFCFTSTATRRH